MSPRARPLLRFLAILALAVPSVVAGAPSGARVRARPTEPARPVRLFVPPISLAEPAVAQVMLGIDVLEADHFAALKGKRIGLLTHAAGVNRYGTSTVQVLQRAPGVRLVMLYSVEHGLAQSHAAEAPVADAIDPRSDLKVISLYKGNVLRPTAAQLAMIDALVVDLQDIGVRSYTFAGAMKTVMEACFERGKEVIVLDRPNPLGGLKVDGPLLDPEFMSDVGRFRVPYVHGLTIGELALMVRNAAPPGGLALSASARARAKLTVIPMRGWNRRMLWPDTGLTWVPPSPRMDSFATVEGYAMTGLGCILGGFRHGLGDAYAFRALTHAKAPEIRADRLARDLTALRLPGLAFRVVGLNLPAAQRAVYVDITDFEAWQPTALGFHLMRMACAVEPRNPFAFATLEERRTFAVHAGSAGFLRDITASGRNVDVEGWLRTWREQARVYQRQSRKFWLYQ